MLQSRAGLTVVIVCIRLLFFQTVVSHRSLLALIARLYCTAGAGFWVVVLFQLADFPNPKKRVSRPGVTQATFDALQ